MRLIPLLIDYYQYEFGSMAVPEKILADASNNLYVLGRSKLLSETNRQIYVVRKFTFATQTWSTIDTYMPTEDATSTVTGFVLDASNNLFYSGWTADWSGGGFGVQRLVFRKGTNFGSAWQNINPVSGLCPACDSHMGFNTFVDAAQLDDRDS